MRNDLGTIVTAVVTPFSDDGSIDFDCFRRLLNHLVETGSDGVVVTGTTGESPTLTLTECTELWKVAVDEVGGRIPVIAGTGTNSTASTVERTRLACDIGVDAVLVVTPYYNKPTRDGLIKHFTVVARASSKPVILYNIPGRSVVNIDPEIVAELARIENVVGLKEANPDPQQLSAVRSMAPDLLIWAGNDDMLVDVLEAGGVGGICVASHVVGQKMRDIIDLWNRGEHDAAREINNSLSDVWETLAITTNPIAIKAAMEIAGFPMGGLRLPLTPATGLQTEKIAAMMGRCGAVESTQV